MDTKQILRKLLEETEKDKTITSIPSSRYEEILSRYDSYIDVWNVISDRGRYKIIKKAGLWDIKDQILNKRFDELTKEQQVRILLATVKVFDEMDRQEEIEGRYFEFHKKEIYDIIDKLYNMYQKNKQPITYDDIEREVKILPSLIRKKAVKIIREVLFDKDVELE